jgi:hypothetical protein
MPNVGQANDPDAAMIAMNTAALLDEIDRLRVLCARAGRTLRMAENNSTLVDDLENEGGKARRWRPQSKTAIT